MLVIFNHGSAGAEPDYTRPGAYIGFAGAYAVDLSAISQQTENSMGLSTRLGYRFTPNIAFEGQFEWIDGFDIVKDPGHRLEVWSLTGNAKGSILTGRIQPFGVLGLGVVRTRFVDAGNGLPSPFEPLSNVDKASFAMRFGAGVEFYITRSIVVAFDASYVLTMGSAQDLDYLSIGFGTQWRF